jgi:pimeloyl-ACP methyl ester carboxylesterase
MSIPTLIFIHGAGTMADFWHEQWKAFPRANFLNLPGHGEEQPAVRSDLGLSGKQLVARIDPLHGRKLGIEAYAEAVADYVERERIDEVVLNGHSMGGAVALTLALRQLVWLRGLILTATGARLGVSHSLLKLLRTDYRAWVERIVQLSFAPVEGEMTYAQRIARNGTRRKLLRTPQDVTLADYESCGRFDMAAQLGEIKVPALVVVGAEDRMTEPALSEQLHAGITGSSLCIISGAGHMLPLEKPDEYNDAVNEFIQRRLNED